MFAISSASTCRTWKISMTKSSWARAVLAAAPRGMMARVLPSETGSICQRSPCWTAAMPFWRRIWLKSGKRSRR